MALPDGERSHASYSEYTKVDGESTVLAPMATPLMGQAAIVAFMRGYWGKANATLPHGLYAPVVSSTPAGGYDCRYSARPDALARLAWETVGMGLNGFTRLALASSDVGPGRQMRLDTTAALCGYFQDYDYAHLAHAAARPPLPTETTDTTEPDALPLPPDEETCWELLNRIPLAPAFVTHTGHGLQAIWLFPDVWTFGDDSDERAKAAAQMKAWGDYLKADANAKGFHLDTVSDLVHQFRIPGTRNVKPNVPPTDVRLMLSTDARHTPAAFCEVAGTPQRTLAPITAFPVTSTALTPQRENAAHAEVDAAIADVRQRQHVGPTERNNRGAELVRAVRELGVTQADAPRFAYRYVRSVGLSGPHPYTTREMDATIRSIYENRQRRADPYWFGDDATTGSDIHPDLQLLDYRAVKRMKAPKGFLGDLLFPRSVACLYGPSGYYKSYIALDWALHVAHNRAWQGRPVDGGPVVYVAGEGEGFMGERIRAWELVNGLSDGTTFDTHDMPFYLLPASVYLTQNGRPEALVDAIRMQLNGAMPRLVVFDTLARMMTGSDENKTPDMNTLVEAATCVYKGLDGCCVLFLHHTGYDTSHMRGNTALIGGADTVIKVKNTTRDGQPGVDDVLELRSEKSRGKGRFTPIPITLTERAWVYDGEAESALAVIPCDAASLVYRTAPTPTRPTVKDNYDPADVKAWELLNKLSVGASEGVTHGAWRDAVVATGKTSRTGFGEALSRLVSAGWVARCGQGKATRYLATAPGRNPFRDDDPLGLRVDEDDGPDDD